MRILLVKLNIFYRFNQISHPKKLLGWNLSPAEIDLVHPYWSQFEAPPYFAHLLLALIYFILMICSFTGNGLVLWIFST